MVLLGLGPSPYLLSTHVLIRQSIPGRPPQKHIHVSIVSVYYEYTECVFGGAGGNRTPVLPVFRPASYNNIFI